MRFIVLIILIGLSGRGFGQDESCLNELLNIYSRLETQMNAAVGNQTVHMEFAIKSEYLIDGSSQSSEVVFTLLSNGKNRYLISNALTIYQDEEVTVNVSDQNKQIIISRSPSDWSRSSKMKEMKIVQDTVLRKADNATCSPSLKNSREYTLSFKRSNAYAHGLQEIRVRTDADNKPIQTRLIYYPGHRYLALSSTIKVFELEANSKEIKEAPLEKIYHRGKLKPQYHGYEVIDYRNEAN